MKELSEYEQNSLNKLGQSIQEGKWSNKGLVQLIELVNTFLQLETIAAHAKRVGKSYNGIKKRNNHIIMMGKKYIFNND